MKVVVIGGGCFGSSTAVELASRGHSVTLVDRVLDEQQAVSANPIAATFDDNKIVRLSYASDALYTSLSLACMYDQSACGAVPIWSSWPVFRRAGLVVLEDESLDGSSPTPTFGAESLKCLAQMQLPAVRPIPSAQLAAFDTATWSDGFLEPDGGWAHCKHAVEDMLKKAVSLGVVVVNEHAAELVALGGRVTQVRTDAGRVLDGFDHVVVAAGSRTPRLLPHLASFFTARAMPVVHFKPRAQDEELLRNMPVWTVGIRQTGYYGFPLHPLSGFCKVGWHGLGWDFASTQVDYDTIAALHAIVKDEVEARFRDFVRTAVPALAEAVEIKSRLCMYCDSRDTDFVIDRDPAHANLTLASGGSGHAFKFMPVAGALTANVVDGSTPHAKLADAQRRFARLAERMQLHVDTLDSCRTSLTASANRAAQVEEAIRRSKQ
jgi:glycine/D-amino acid oxidase-like deaminating enzyme